MSSVEFPELVVHNIGGMRFYEAPDGNKYPSITSVLSKQPGKQKGLQEWRERIGEQQARIVSGKAARRGTAFHNICEDMFTTHDKLSFNTKLEEEHKKKNFHQQHFPSLYESLLNLNHFYNSNTKKYYNDGKSSRGIWYN